MFYNYSTQNLETVTADFYNATGVNLSILDSNFKQFGYTPSTVDSVYCRCIQCTAEGNRKCAESDLCLLQRCKEEQQAVRHICHGGLVDIAVPLFYETSIIGYIILGQIKNSESFPLQSLRERYAPDEVAHLQTLYAALPLFDEEKINSIIRLATMLSKMILVDGIVKPKQLSTLDIAVSFIHNNLDQDLSVAFICQKTFLSTSVLYNLFRKHFHCTVSEYVNAKRVEKAAHLLLTTDLPVKDIARKVGFTDPAYFSKKFKQIQNVQPLQYRKEHLQRPANFG